MNTLQSFLATLPCGFLTDATLPKLVELDRLHPCLVRCGGGRFVCGAQDVDHFIKCVALGGDYVRDISIPARCEERAAQWQPATPYPLLAAQLKPATPAPLPLGYNPHGRNPQFDDDWRGDHDGGL